MNLGMGMQPATDPRIAGVAASLMAAWESGDRFRLEAAVREAASQLGDDTTGSRHMSEVRELLQGVVQGIHGLLGQTQAPDFHCAPQGKIYHDLLLHVQETASEAAACPSLQLRAGAAS